MRTRRTSAPLWYRIIAALTIGGLLLSGIPDHVTAQEGLDQTPGYAFAPVGEHHAATGAGLSVGFGTVSPTGTYHTAVPLDLPSPRGDLPLPFAVVYGGGSRLPNCSRPRSRAMSSGVEVSRGSPVV